MYFQFACSRCGKSLRAREEHIGRRVVCPYCRAQVPVEQPAPQEESPVDALKNLQTSAAPTTSARRTTTTASSSQSSAGNWVDGTNVSLLWAGLFGMVSTVCFYFLVSPLYLAGNYFGLLFIKTDASFWVPMATVFLAAWAASVLGLKSRKLKRQRQSMLFDLLPNQYGEDINVDNLDKFIAHVAGLPGNARESFLVNRVKRGLEHFRVRKSASEVATILSSQSDIDANAVESSYSMMNVFIWAIPILGFIGTVIGISAAVGGFSGNLDAAGDVSALKESLGNVTGGLGTAFDTTLVALVLSMLVMFPTSSMKKAEEDLLNWVDEYCNENLMKRLNDGREGGGAARSGGATSVEIQNAINAAMADHHAELQTWTKKLEVVGKTLAKQVVENLKEVNQHEQSLYQEKMGQLNGVSEMTDSMREAAESLGSYCHNLQTGLTSLSQVLERLGEQQVVVQQVEPPKRKGWFGRRNGR